MRALLAVALFLGMGLILAQREPADMPPPFNKSARGGVSAYLAERASRFDDIHPDGPKKRDPGGDPGARNVLPRGCRPNGAPKSDR